MVILNYHKYVLLDILSETFIYRTKNDFFKLFFFVTIKMRFTLRNVSEKFAFPDFFQQ